MAEFLCGIGHQASIHHYHDGCLDVVDFARAEKMRTDSAEASRFCMHFGLFLLCVLLFVSFFGAIPPHTRPRSVFFFVFLRGVLREGYIALFWTKKKLTDRAPQPTTLTQNTRNLWGALR